MPASHAGDHRSEAGQGRQFHCPQSILSDALLWYGSQLGATPGGGSSLVAVRKHRSRATAQAGFIRPPCPGQHWGLRPFSASLQQPVDFFCKEIVPGQQRLDAPTFFVAVIFRASGSEGIEDPADRESASLGGASPLSPTIF